MYDLQPKQAMQVMLYMQCHMPRHLTRKAAGELLAGVISLSYHFDFACCVALVFIHHLLGDPDSESRKEGIRGQLVTLGRFML